MKSRLAKLILYGIMVPIGISITGCKQRGETDATVLPQVDVVVKRVTLGTIRDRIRVTGRTSALRQETFRAPIAGKIVTFPFVEGDELRRDQTVTVLRSREAQAVLDGARELVEEAQTPEQKREAERALQLAEKDVQDIDLRARFNSILVNRKVNEGEYVVESEELFTLIDPRSLVFFADVPVQVLRKVKVGQEADIHFFGVSDATARGVIKLIEPRLDPLAESARVRIDFSRLPSSVKAEMFGEAIITVGTHRNVLVVPLSAILKNEETGTVSVMKIDVVQVSEKGLDTIGVLVPVTLGVVEDSVAQISGRGIGEGILVAVRGHYGIPDSTKVRVVKE
ncbi:MAG: efflux RND transporter periplasmic adaptor subunit [Bacteroidota bacterium]